MLSGEPDEELSVEITLHALGWLACGNLVGLWLATLLLAPELGGGLAALAYGRWVPVHLGVQLYGWCAVPLLGLLFRLYRVAESDPRGARWALAAWSGTLAAAALSWLAGRVSGKPFLEYSGAARVLLVGTMTLVATVLARAWWRRTRVEWAGGRRARWRAAGAGLLLLVLAALPATMWIATSPAVEPPVNPASGGATGTSLMGSSLAVVAIFLLTPAAVGLRPRSGWRAVAPSIALLAAHLLWFVLLDHGPHTHHEWVQIASLASLAIWPPALARFFRAFDWPTGSRRWLASLLAWGALLVGTGVLVFLPGILERAKFTHLLVAHAHLAMAGMCSSYLVLVLVGLLRRTPLAHLFSGRAAFVGWHLGGAVHLAALVGLGILEARDPGAPFQADPTAVALWATRAAAGAVMAAASLAWALAAVRTLARKSVSAGGPAGLGEAA